MEQTGSQGRAEANNAHEMAQGIGTRVWRAHVWPAVCVALLLGACSSVPKEINPVEWWHGLQGGPVADQRPPPPGADEPFPNLGTIPPRPAPSDPKLRQQIADSLVADRGNAQHEAAGVQLVDPSNPDAAPGLFGRGSVRPPAPAPVGGPSARLTATDAAEPAPRSPPPMATDRPSGIARAPVGGVQSADLAPPAEADQESHPALPSAPPPPANLPGAPASAPLPPERPASAIPTTTVSDTPAPTVPSTAATTSPAATSPTAAATGPAEPGRAVGVPFATGSAIVPRPSIAALRQLAARRGKGSVAITGFGEAADSDPATQSAALALALARAQAVAGALTAAGVPASVIKVDAEAAGRGAAARLVE